VPLIDFTGVPEARKSYVMGFAMRIDKYDGMALTRRLDDYFMGTVTGSHRSIDLTAFGPRAYDLLQ